MSCSSSLMAQGSNFSEANLSGVIIQDANLKNANFNSANLSSSDFSGSDITGAKVDGAVINNMKLAGVTGDIGRLAGIIKQEKERKRIDADGTTMKELVDQHSVWLNTAGNGVIWLHIRLDSRPKYYKTDTYRKPKFAKKL